MRRIRNRARREDGQALVEFAFVLPLLLLFLFGIIDFGIAVNNYNANTNLANVAARDLSVLGTGQNYEYCNGVKYSTYQSWISCEASQLGVGTVTYECVSDIGASAASSTVLTAGDSVVVKIGTTFSWLGIITNGDGYVGGISPTTSLIGTATMRVEDASSGNTFLTTSPPSTCPTS